MNLLIPLSPDAFFGMKIFLNQQRADTINDHPYRLALSDFNDSIRPSAFYVWLGRYNTPKQRAKAFTYRMPAHVARILWSELQHADPITYQQQELLSTLDRALKNAGFNNQLLVC